jgi:hypothetical protein
MTRYTVLSYATEAVVQPRRCLHHEEKHLHAVKSPGGTFFVCGHCGAFEAWKPTQEKTQ